MRLAVALAVSLLSAVALPAAAEDFASQIQFRAGQPANGTALVQALDSVESRRLLHTSADVLRAHPDMKVQVQGFSDAQECQAADCDRLASVRADLVRRWLIDCGVAGDRLIAESFGTHRPVGSEGSPLNRRVELNVVNSGPAGER